MLSCPWLNKRVEINWFSARGTGLSPLLQVNQFIISTLNWKQQLRKGHRTMSSPVLISGCWQLRSVQCWKLKSSSASLHKSQLIHEGIQGNSTFPFSLIIYTSNEPSNSILTLSFLSSHPFLNGLSKQRCLFRSGKEYFAGFSLSPHLQMCGLGHLENQKIWAKVGLK